MIRAYSVISACVLLCIGCSDGTRRTDGNNGGGGGGGSDGGGMGQPLPPMKQTVIANGAPADSPNRFGGGADLGRAPAVVYPPDGVLVPPNLNELELQYTRATGTDLFELRFTAGLLELDVYTTCVTVGSGCGFVPDENTWNLLAAYGRGNTVTVQLRATSRAGGGVGEAAPRTLSFTQEDLLGGLYYWAAANGAVNRYDFGLRGQKAESFYTPVQAGGAECVGCHALSRDGTRVAVGLNVPGPATLRVLDVATRATLFSQGGGAPGAGGSNFEALSPDGSKLLANSGNDLQLLDAVSGKALSATLPNANMPDWSADGQRVVFARNGMPVPCFGGLCPVSPGVDAASLFLAPVAGNGFGTPTQLVAGSSTVNNYYPSFSPDGKWVAFNRSAQNSYDAPDAKILVAGTQGGAPPFELGLTNMIAGNSWPKFAPFVQHFGGKTIFWLTFSSRRDYGLRLVNSASSSKDGQVSQLWMVAFSPDSGEADPGYPPFWLPFQDIKTGNHIAQWTEKVARQPCSPGPDNGGCGVGEMCVNGQCISSPIQ